MHHFTEPFHACFAYLLSRNRSGYTSLVGGERNRGGGSESEAFRLRYAHTLRKRARGGFVRPTRRGLMWRANARQAGEFEIFLSRRRGERGEGEQKQRNGLHTAGNGNRASLSLSLSPSEGGCQETKRHYHAASRVRPSVRPSVRQTDADPAISLVGGHLGHARARSRSDGHVSLRFISTNPLETDADGCGRKKSSSQVVDERLKHDAIGRDFPSAVMSQCVYSTA